LIEKEKPFLIPSSLIHRARRKELLVPPFETASQGCRGGTVKL